MDKAEPYNGEKPYTIVYGEDKIGQKMIVWVGDKEVHSEFADKGASPEAIKQKLLAKAPGRKCFEYRRASCKTRMCGKFFLQNERAER